MPINLTEAQVTEQCIDYLRAEGWRCIRLNSGLFQRPNGKHRVRIGEPGMPDWICVPGGRVHGHLRPAAFFLELKRSKGGQLSDAQSRWIYDATEDGLLVCVCRGLDELREWMGKML